VPKEDRYDDEDDEDEEEDPYGFFKIFGDPNKFLKDFDPSKLFGRREFRDIFKDIFEQIMKQLPKEYQGLSPEDFAKEFMKNKSKFGIKGPIMYGFNVDFTADGKPKVDSFGNIKTEPYSGKPRVKNVREPLVEVNEEQDQIVVIAEIPGVTKEDIELKATTRSLTISTKEKSASRKYYKEVALPTAINSDYARARYTNGILEVKLKKIAEEHTNIQVD